MKKTHLFAGVCLLICSMAAVLLTTACTSGVPLPQPDHLSINADTLLMSWAPIEDAKGYMISFNGTEEAVRTNSYDLQELEPGDYTISVKARGDDETYSDSPWSETVSFTRNVESGLVYKLINDNTEYSVTGIGSASGDVIIDDYFRGKPVTTIADSAFSGRGTLESIVFGENITTVGARAFYNCSFLKSVTLNDKLTSIGEYAFQSCRLLESITLPPQITAVERYTFSYCRQLKTVTYEGTITRIDEAAFTNCSALTEIYIPDSVTYLGAYAFTGCQAAERAYIGTGITEILDGTFDGCVGIGELSLGDNIRTIGTYAFNGCVNISSIRLPAELTYLGAFAFQNCTNLAEVTVPGDNLEYIGQQVFENDKIMSATEGLIYVGDWIVGTNHFTDVTIPWREGTVGIAASAFRGTTSLNAGVIIPDSVRYINEYAFSNCNLMYLTLGSGLEEVSDGAFGGCNYLTTLRFSENSKIKHIGQQAFAYGQRLTIVEIPEGVETIDNMAFYGCTALATVTLPSTLRYIGTSVFEETNLYTESQTTVIYAGDWAVGVTEEAPSTISVREGTRGVANYAFFQRQNLFSVILPDSLLYIGKGAFFGCAILQWFDIPENVIEIGEYAFTNCVSLQNITLPAGLTEIAPYTFYGCALLTIRNEVHSGIKSIGEYAFYGCGMLTGITLSEGLESIGNRAFGRSALTEITIPDSVTYIGEYAFRDCLELTTVTLGSGLTELSPYTFRGCVKLSQVTLGENLHTIGQGAFRSCTALTEIDLKNVRTIAKYAFAECSGLTYVVLPSSVETVDSYAFFRCSLLAGAVIGPSVTMLGNHAFYGCPQLTFYLTTESAPEGWGLRWNSARYAVIWGCTLSADATYVHSFTMGENSISYLNPNTYNIRSPYRKGYVFAGWATSESALGAEYSNDETDQIPQGTTVYAVWLVAPETPETPETPEAGGEQDASAI